MREITLRLRDTPVQAQAAKAFWAAKKLDAQRAAALVQQDNGDWK